MVQFGVFPQNIAEFRREGNSPCGFIIATGATCRHLAHHCGNPEETASVCFGGRLGQLDRVFPLTLSSSFCYRYLPKHSDHHSTLIFPGAHFRHLPKIFSSL